MEGCRQIFQARGTTPPLCMNERRDVTVLEIPPDQIITGKLEMILLISGMEDFLRRLTGGTDALEDALVERTLRAVEHVIPLIDCEGRAGGFELHVRVLVVLKFYRFQLLAVFLRLNKTLIALFELLSFNLLVVLVDADRDSYGQSHDDKRDDDNERYPLCFGEPVPPECETVLFRATGHDIPLLRGSVVTLEPTTGAGNPR